MLEVGWEGWDVAQKCMAHWHWEALGHPQTLRKNKGKAGVEVTACMSGFLSEFGGGGMNTEHHAGKHYAFELHLQWIVFRNKMNKLLLYLRISVISSQAEEARLREVTILGFRAEMTSLLTREGQWELGVVGHSTCAWPAAFWDPS